ncbi:hypothetical protein ACSBR1_012859 [Camellia fascicularis]
MGRIFLMICYCVLSSFVIMVYSIFCSWIPNFCVCALIQYFSPFFCLCALIQPHHRCTAVQSTRPPGFSPFLPLSIEYEHVLFSNSYVYINVCMLMFKFADFFQVHFHDILICMLGFADFFQV